jgi:hypothetical protein
MEAIDPIYEEGCAAGRAGVTAAKNPYPCEKNQLGSYVNTPYLRWEMGRRRGERWCPHCDGTGQLPEGV